MQCGAAQDYFKESPLLQIVHLTWGVIDGLEVLDFIANAIGITQCVNRFSDTKLNRTVGTRTHKTSTQIDFGICRLHDLWRARDYAFRIEAIENFGIWNSIENRFILQLVSNSRVDHKH